MPLPLQLPEHNTVVHKKCPILKRPANCTIPGPSRLSFTTKSRPKQCLGELEISELPSTARALFSGLRGSTYGKQAGPLVEFYHSAGRLGAIQLQLYQLEQMRNRLVNGHSHWHVEKNCEMVWIMKNWILFIITQKDGIKSCERFLNSKPNVQLWDINCQIPL